MGAFLFFLDLKNLEPLSVFALSGDPRHFAMRLFLPGAVEVSISDELLLPWV